jgi:hypothetical protein
VRGLIAGVLTLCAIAATAVVQSTTPSRNLQLTESAWRTFEGNWSASGRIQPLPTERPQTAAVAQLSGALSITSGEGLSRGFRAEAIGYDDGGGVLTGRAVWTDERGNQIFSTLRGETIATKRRVTGTITGGTGRYAGVTGDYEFEWQYIIAGDDGTIQGRTVSLRGRVRTGGGSAQ